MLNFAQNRSTSYHELKQRRLWENLHCTVCSVEHNEVVMWKVRNHVPGGVWCWRWLHKKFIDHVKNSFLHIGIIKSGENFTTAASVVHPYSISSSAELVFTASCSGNLKQTLWGTFLVWSPWHRFSATFTICSNGSHLSEQIFFRSWTHQEDHRLSSLIFLIRNCSLGSLSFHFVFFQKIIQIPILSFQISCKQCYKK